MSPAKRSTSATNLKQQGDSVVSKRLSTSSAAITKSPEKSKLYRPCIPLPLPQKHHRPVQLLLPLNV